MKSILLLTLVFTSLFLVVNPYFGSSNSSVPNMPQVYNSPRIFSEESNSNLSSKKPSSSEIITLTEGRSRISVRFAQELTDPEISDLEKKGIQFGKSPLHAGFVYIVDITQQGLNYLKNYPLFRKAEPLTHFKKIPPRDLSIPAIDANFTWQLQDAFGFNLTGKGVLIANLDSGIEWQHPDFFFTDENSYIWYDANSDADFDNGTDGIDLNGNNNIESTEKLYVLDTDSTALGTFETDTDWLWLDNGTQSGRLDNSDTFFVVNDTSGDLSLDISESIIRLKTPKTKYVVHKNASGIIEFWERGVNLTSCPLSDTMGHGTSVASILNGGQLGYRKYVGVAPEAELMSINIFGNNSLSVEEGLIWAKNHNADVILIEIGSWTYEYLDGSSNAEAIIDQLTAQGIPVIVPAGNLGGAKRHAQKNGSAGSVLTTQFSIPSLTPNITSTYITILTRDSFNNSIQVNITEPTSGGGQIIHQIPLGYGYLNWSYYYGTNLAVRAFISNSSRGTHMIGLDIWGTFRVDNYTVHILSPYSAAYHYYISDDVTSWSGGAQWVDGVNNISTITWPSTADTAISVASYHTRYGYPIAPFGGLASFSPSGPRIDGMPKISVAAPGGNDVISAWANNSGYIPLYKNFGGYTLFGGTSAAGPHVAGAVAILLQLDPNCGANAKSILEVTAYPDWMVPRPLPDSQWGYGKLSVLAAILNVSDIPVITNISRSLNIPKDYETVNVTTTINKIVLGTVTPLLIQLNWTTDNWITCSVSAPTPSPSFCKIEHTIPAYPNGTTVQYKVNITGYGWSRMSTIYGYTVADYLDPTVNDLYTNPETVHANAPFRIYASFSDDGGIATAILSFNSNGTWINASMTSQNLTLCYVDLTVNEVGNMSVRVYASDFNGHWVAEDMPDIVVNPPSSTASTTSPTSPTSTSPTSPTSSTPSTSSGWLFVIALSSVALLVIIKRVKRKVKRD